MNCSDEDPGVTVVLKKISSKRWPAFLIPFLGINALIAAEVLRRNPGSQVSSVAASETIAIVESPVSSVPNPSAEEAGIVKTQTSSSVLSPPKNVSIPPSPIREEVPESLPSDSSSPDQTAVAPSVVATTVVAVTTVPFGDVSVSGHGKRIGYTQLWVSSDGRYSIGVRVSADAIAPVARFPSTRQVYPDCQSENWYTGEAAPYFSFRGFASHNGAEFSQVTDLATFPKSAFLDCDFASFGISYLYYAGRWMDPVVYLGPNAGTPVWVKFELINLGSGEKFLSPAIRVDPSSIP